MVKKAIAYAMFGGEPKNPGKYFFLKNLICTIRQVLISIRIRYLCLRIVQFYSLRCCRHEHSDTTDRYPCLCGFEH